MNRAEAWRTLVDITSGWVDDPDSDIVAAEAFEGRWAVRMRQRARDFTTVWFEVGERTIGYEAYVLPNPPAGHAEVYRQCLRRNQGAWRAFFAIDHHGDLFLRGRLSLDEVAPDTLDEVLGAIYELVEISFGALVRSGFGR